MSEYITEAVPLHDIANKKINLNGSEVTLDIPAFQRGLVWNPAQVEALWDSIMRGIQLAVLLSSSMQRGLPPVQILPRPSTVFLMDSSARMP